MALNNTIPTRIELTQAGYDVDTVDSIIGNRDTLLKKQGFSQHDINVYDGLYPRDKELIPSLMFAFDNKFNLTKNEYENSKNNPEVLSQLIDGKAKSFNNYYEKFYTNDKNYTKLATDGLLKIQKQKPFVIPDLLQQNLINPDGTNIADYLGANNIGLYDYDIGKPVYDYLFSRYPDFTQDNKDNLHYLFSRIASNESNTTMKFDAQKNRGGAFGYDTKNEITAPGSFRGALILLQRQYDRDGDPVPFWVLDALKHNNPTRLSPAQEIELQAAIYNSVPAKMRLGIAKGNKEVMLDYYRIYINDDKQKVEEFAKLLEQNDNVVPVGFDLPFFNDVDYSVQNTFLEPYADRVKNFLGGQGYNAILGNGSLNHGYIGRGIDYARFHFGYMSKEEAMNKIAVADSIHQSRSNGFNSFMHELVTFGLNSPAYSGFGRLFVAGTSFTKMPLIQSIIGGAGSFVGPELMHQPILAALRDGQKINNLEQLNDYLWSNEALQVYMDSAILGSVTAGGAIMFRRVNSQLLANQIAKNYNKDNFLMWGGAIGKTEAAGSIFGLGTGMSVLDYYHTGEFNFQDNYLSASAFVGAVGLSKYAFRNFKSMFETNKIRDDHFKEGTLANDFLKTGYKDPATVAGENTFDLYMKLKKGVNVIIPKKFKINEEITGNSKVVNEKEQNGTILLETESPSGAKNIELAENVLKDNVDSNLRYNEEKQKYESILESEPREYKINETDTEKLSFNNERPNLQRNYSLLFVKNALEEVVRHYGTTTDTVLLLAKDYPEFTEYIAESGIMPVPDVEKNLKYWKQDTEYDKTKVFGTSFETTIDQHNQVISNIFNSKKNQFQELNLNVDTGSIAIFKTADMYVGLPSKLYKILSNPKNLKGDEEYDKPSMVFHPKRGMDLNDVREFMYSTDVQEIGRLIFVDKDGKVLASVKPLNVARYAQLIEKAKKEYKRDDEAIIIKDTGLKNGGTPHEPHVLIESIFDEKTVNSIYNQNTGLDYIDASMIVLAVTGKKIQNIRSAGSYGHYDPTDNTVNISPLKMVGSLKFGTGDTTEVPFGLYTGEQLPGFAYTISQAVTAFHEIGHMEQGNADGFTPSNYGYESWEEFIKAYGVETTFGGAKALDLPFDFTIEEFRNRAAKWEKGFEAIEKMDADALYKLFGTGNIIGNLTKAKGFIYNAVNKKTGEIAGVLDKTILDALYEEALADAKIAEKEWQKEIDAMGLQITPKDILSVWNKTNARDFLPPELYDKIARADEALKKEIIKQAMKGIIHDDLKVIVDLINDVEITKPDFAAQAKKRFAEAVQREMNRRGMVTLEQITNEIADISLIIRPLTMFTNITSTKMGYEKVTKESFMKVLKMNEKEIAKEIEKVKKKIAAIPEAELSKELTNYEKYLNAFDAVELSYRRNSAEMYADFMSALLAHPELVKDRAPNALELFHNFMDERPVFKKIYTEILNQLNAGTNARADAAIKFMADDIKKESDNAISRLNKRTKSLILDPLSNNFIDLAKQIFVSKEAYINARTDSYRPSLTNGIASWKNTELSPTGKPTGRYVGLSEAERVQAKIDDYKMFGSTAEAYQMDTLNNVVNPAKEYLAEKGKPYDYFSVLIIVNRLHSLKKTGERDIESPYKLISEDEYFVNLEKAQEKVEALENKENAELELQQAKEKLDILKSLEKYINQFRTIEDLKTHFDENYPELNKIAEVFYTQNREFMRNAFSHGATESITREQYDMFIEKAPIKFYATLKPVDKIYNAIASHDYTGSFGGSKLDTAFHEGFFNTPLDPVFATVQKLSVIAAREKRNQALLSMIGKPIDGEYMSERIPTSSINYKEDIDMWKALDNTAGFFIQYADVFQYYDSWHSMTIPFDTSGLTKEELKEYNEHNPKNTREHIEFVRKFSKKLFKEKLARPPAVAVEYKGKVVEQTKRFKAYGMYQYRVYYGNSGDVRKIVDRKSNNTLTKEEYVELAAEQNEELAEFYEKYKKAPKTKRVPLGIYPKKQFGSIIPEIRISYEDFNPRAEIKNRKEMEKKGYVLEGAPMLPRKKRKIRIGRRTVTIETNEIDRAGYSRPEYRWVNEFMSLDPIELKLISKFTLNSVSLIKQGYTGANPAFWWTNIMMDVGTVLQNTDVKLINLSIKKWKDGLPPDQKRLMTVFGRDVSFGYSLVTAMVESIKQSKYLYAKQENLDAISKWMYQSAVVLARKDRSNFAQTYTDALPKEVVKDIEDLTKDPKDYVDFIKDPVTRSAQQFTAAWNALSQIGKATEFVTRNAVARYKINQKQAGKLNQSQRQIAQIVRRQIVDFTQGGNPLLEIPYLFYRATVGGFYAVGKSEKRSRQEDPRQKWYKRNFWQATWKYAATFELLRALGLFGFLGEEVEKMMKAVKKYDDLFYWIVPIGKEKANQTEIRMLGFDAYRPVYLTLRKSPSVSVQSEILRNLISPVIKEARYSILAPLQDAAGVKRDNPITRGDSDWLTSESGTDFKNVVTRNVPSESGAYEMVGDLISIIMQDQIENPFNGIGMIDPDVIKGMKSENMFQPNPGEYKPFASIIGPFDLGRVHKEYYKQALSAFWNKYFSSTMLTFKADIGETKDKPEGAVSKYTESIFGRVTGINRFIRVGNVMGEREATTDIKNYDNSKALDRANERILLNKLYSGNDLTQEETNELDVYLLQNKNDTNFRIMIKNNLYNNGNYTYFLDKYYNAQSKAKRIYFLERIIESNKGYNMDYSKEKEREKAEKELNTDKETTKPKEDKYEFIPESLR